MVIQENLKQIIKTLPENVTLVAVSKTKPIEALQEAYDGGQRVFGENKVQEMCEKYAVLPKDIEWHMIGHLQRNKVKYIAPFVNLIHGVESLKLLQEINKQGVKNKRVINCLLQIKIATEESKFGLTKDEALFVLNSEVYLEMKNISIKGVMGMATFTDDEQQIKAEFKELKTIFDELKVQKDSLEILSMGMSGDYALAIEEGSTMVRVGSAIFGERNYTV